MSQEVMTDKPTTPLAAFRECLAIIEEVEPGSRGNVFEALGRFENWCTMVIGDDTTDWKSKAKKYKSEAAALRMELEEAQAELDAELDPCPDEDQS